ncbi:MAG: Rpn family recombination-promoting nuclease/putative transposase [Methylococcales bacterium]|nr:Rpn family recombination-promoting nuclease/putative transposase [Methylococcales bacterium]
MISKYFNPYTDFGFKKLFGEEGSKDLLIDFLNQLLPLQHQIAQLSFKNPENMADTEEERKSIFDIYCESTNGERFIVEMQKAKMHFFKDRSLFYSTFPVREQSKKGAWDFRLVPVYFIAILDFTYDEKEDERKFRRDVCLKDQDGDVFYDKLHFKFLQMPLFNKQEHELETHFDKWVYFLKHLEDFDHIPAILNEPIFQKGFEIAEVSHLSSDQYDVYLKSVLSYNEAKAVTDTAFQDGERAKAIDVAKSMLAEHFDVETIARISKLSVFEIEALTKVIA